MVSSLTPLWAELSFEESRDVVAALARLGFVYDPPPAGAPVASRHEMTSPSLWDAWGQVRPVLLRERGDLDGEPA